MPAVSTRTSYIVTLGSFCTSVFLARQIASLNAAAAEMCAPSQGHVYCLSCSCLEVDVALGQRLRMLKCRAGANGTCVSIIAVRKGTVEGPNADCICSCPSKEISTCRWPARPKPAEGSLCLPVKYKAVLAAVQLPPGPPIPGRFRPSCRI